MEGIAKEIVFAMLKTHDLELCRDMLKTSPCLKENDMLINKRGIYYAAQSILYIVSS